MNSFYRSPQVEDGTHNIILQNRCGNRLSLLFYEGTTDLELVYKPNAFRRKEFRARNFSNRDNQTTLFETVQWPDVGAEAELQFDYDPFHTRIGVSYESGARNALQVLNLADENAFVLTARAPLLLAIRPHGEFVVRDGLLLEEFRDRGEGIVSFVKFPGFEFNRYRVLEDGTHVLQILENDPVIIGGEENEAQVTRVLDKLRGLSFVELTTRNEAVIAADLEAGRAELADPEFQEVYDLNRRVSWSGLDAGGACFGAINRIYYLIWVRDGSMSTAHMALAGNPEYSRIWAPFLFANPSITRRDEGSVFEEFGQMVGSRWSKAEDDGLFYATWSLFTYFRMTGDDKLLRTGSLDLLLRVIDAHLEKCWDAETQLMVSDTLGEESLRGSPYFGYDVVNGAIQKAHGNVQAGDRVISHAASFYHQINTCNVLRMALCLLDAAGRGEVPQAAVYRERFSTLESSLREGFLDETGRPYSMKVIFEDGTSDWIGLNDETDCWEYAWALSQGPFFPLHDRQVAGALALVDFWPKRERRSYGLCPWNVLNRFLFESRALSAEESEENLRTQVGEALTLTEKYPMRGALHEDQRSPHSWRGLPFSAGAFTVAQTGRLLAPLAQGLAVRDGGMTRRLTNFRYRLSAIDAAVEGVGPAITRWTLNGQEIPGSLQIPENLLRAGRNHIVVYLGESSRDKMPRLYRSDAELLAVRQEEDGSRVYHFHSAIPAVLEFEGDPGAVEISTPHGDHPEVTREEHPQFPGNILRIESAGEFLLTLGAPE